MQNTLNVSKNMESKLPIYLKYSTTATQTWLDPSAKLKPSDLSKPSLDVNPDDYPLIVQFNNLMDNCAQVHSNVDIDQPLFQPAPKIIVFENYEPFVVVKKKLFFRNKDTVARRIKLLKPDTPYFEISAPQTLNGEPLKQSKIAAGMEVCFIITFKPQEVREYSWDLVCSTERENFIVPLRAIGLRPLLTIPDEIDFGACPIKSKTEKKIIIQNLGTSVAKFNLISNQPEFICPEQDLVIEANATFPLELFFVPQDKNFIYGEIQVNFSNGIKCFINVKGLGKNVEVSLSAPLVTLEPSYISLFSQKTLKVRNLSDAPIKFRWKSFATEEEENSERERLLLEINRIEDEERKELQLRVMQGYYNNNDESIDNLGIVEPYSFQEDDPTNPLLPFKARIDEAILIRKYRNLRKALETDLMLFVDDIFDVSPIEGEVWARSEMEITVCFRPDTAALFNCLAYLDVSGRNDRLPLQLTGQGIGPHAALSFDVLDIGDVFVNDVNYYNLVIKNKGDIPAQWTFMSSLTRFSSKFEFTPSDGYLLPNQSQTISIKFESDILGEFSEHFRFSLLGNEDMLVCQIKGHVIGPTFHFDCKSIEFGIVSFDYLHSTKIKLVNTSKVPMVYNLHIPQDGTYLKKEFNIEPSRGTLSPKEETEILVEFIPTTVKVYDYSLSVDVLGVGDMLLSIPITAECITSTIKVELPSRELDFGDCFIRYPFEKELTLINLSDKVHTKFEILPQPKHTKSVASYESVPSVAVIEPGDSMTVKVRLIGQKLGAYKVPLTITVAGSQEPPMQAVLSFNTIGPRVAVNCTELKWGNIDCLKDSSRILTIINEGLINASMKLFLKMARSCYRIDVQELVLEAGQSYDLEITANLDDSVLNKDEIHIVVEEGDNIMVPLIAKGIGTTMYCKQPIDIMDLGVQLTNVYFEKQIVLENKGRRPQQLKWYNKTVKLENQARLAKAKKLGKDTAGTAKLPKNLAPIEPNFTVTPEEITLRSRTATTFTFRGFSPIPKNLSEIFILESKVGKDRNMKQIIETEVKCQVVNPLLEFSSNNLTFVYTWEKDVEPQLQKKPLVLTNNSSIALSFVLKTEIPFNLNSWEHTLNPGQNVEIIVEFDPLYRDDKESHIVEKAIQITYRGHPQKDTILLNGEVIFPNLKFDLNAINFGCVLNDTSKTMKLKASNSCKIDVKYEWMFLEQTAGTKGKSRSAVFSTPPSHIFDILPVRSLIPPGESEDVEFIMLSTTNAKLNSTVVCVVEGGPEYKFLISGESSNVAFELSKSIIDFGKVVFTEYGEQEFRIRNNGKVNFNYKLEPTTDFDAQYLEFDPPEGKVIANQESKIIIKIFPGIPTNFMAKFTVYVAHFDPVIVDCYCQGIFPTVISSLPRQRKIGPYGETENVKSSVWDNILSKATNNLIAPDPQLLPPIIAPPPASGSTLNPPLYIEPNSLYPPFPPIDDDQNSVAQTLGQNSLGSTYKGLSPNSVDVEVQRIILCDLLEKRITALPDQPILLQHRINQNINLKDIVVARYICDFGNVIMGQTKKKIFKVTNASLHGQLSWIFDKKYLSATGFSIEPEKVMKLTENNSVDFTVKYFARTNQKIGPKSYILPIEVQGLPTVQLICNANVCLPEIDLSSGFLDFGKVLIGRSNKIYVSLKNISPVVTNWSFRRNGGKDETCFNTEPSSGSLRPFKKCIVAIEFIPLEGHKCSAEFLLRVDQNKKPKSLRMIGEGIVVPLKFEPSNVEITPVLPGSLGEERVVTITNSSDYPIEFFSLDFDPVYKDEESILSAIPDYDSSGILRTVLRQPGQGLGKEITEFHEKLKLSQSISEDNVKDSNISENPIEETNNPDDHINSPNMIIELKDPPLRTVEAYRDKSLQQDIVVIGPPMMGISSLVSNLSKKLLLPIKTIDDMIFDVASTLGDIGFNARLFSGTLLTEEKENIKAKENELLALAEQSKIDAVESYKKDKKGKAKDIPEEVYNTPEVQAYEAYLKQNEKTIDSLVKILKFRATWKDLGDGIIIDNVYSKLYASDMIISALKDSFPGIIYFHLGVSRELEGYRDWLSHLSTSKLHDIDQYKKSIDSFKKLLFKSVKPPKGKSNESITKELELEFESSIPEAIPVGDESWIDQQTGLIVELESNDFKSLEDKEKFLYLRHILYSQYLQLKEAESTVSNLESIILNFNQNNATSDINPEIESNPENQLGQNSMPSHEKKVLYDNYINSIVPLLNSMKLHEEEVNSIPNLNENITSETDQIDAPIKIENNEENTSNDNDQTTLVDPNPPETSLESIPEKKIISCPIFDLLLEGDESIDNVLQSSLAILPTPKVSIAERENVLPPNEVYQIYRKPVARPNKKLIKLFKIVDFDKELKSLLPEPEPIKEPVVIDPKASKKGAKPTKAVVEEPPPELTPPPVEPEAPSQTRWMIPAQSSIQFRVRFTCEKEGKFEANLEFEIVGTSQKFNLPCSAVCEYPKIILDTRTLFSKRLKALNQNNPYPTKRFVIQENFYSFGALALFKKPEWKQILPESSNPEESKNYQLLETTNSDIIKLTNNGLYKCEINLNLEYEENEPKDSFLIEPSIIEIDIGETKEVRAWALPREIREYSTTLALQIKNNPTVTRFPLKCCGADPTINIDGPWSEALAQAEEALAKNTDKKKIKELEGQLNSLKEAFLLDFNRVLIGKVEIRSFNLVNTCSIPVSWEIVPEDFTDSNNISFHPKSGVVAYNSTTTIEVHFTSPVPLMLTGSFTLKYSDNEGGLDSNRAISKKFKINAEGYAITAVSLNSDGKELQGTSELNFGLMRVGDYTVQNLKMGNKGKYKIGYSFILSTPFIQDLIKIEPMEGTIEAGNSLAEIKVTFCSKKGELLLNGNSDVIVNISEPSTGEIVEKFPLLLHAEAKYNKFRLQPSKGISFGAMRFDADPRVKRAELRNESKFEITYVVCPAIAEHDEIDDLDAAAFAAYAYSSPAAIRPVELGENYKERISAPDNGKGKKESKPPAKGKGNAVEAAPTSTLNPLVQDPDNLLSVPLPVDPLVVGAFTIHPRIATVMPGQAVSIDMKFDPSGCETAKEKLRICISGADPNEQLTQVLRTFELVGESCLPALVNDDMNSIFEEQEVVSSLIESTGERSDSGEGKLEKLPLGKVVFAEAEKMLAFGPVSCNQTGKGVVERVKISNPTKIDIKVKFKILSVEAAAAMAAESGTKNNSGGKDAKGKDSKAKDTKGKGKGNEPEVEMPQAFIVQPEFFDIPPHEHRFVSVFFNPVEMKTYRSVFLAEIDDEGITTSIAPKVSNSGKSLMFDLGGTGTLPFIRIDQPVDRDQEGKLLIQYPKTLVERSIRKSIVIKNDGVMPSTCLFEMSGDQDFLFPSKGTSLVIDSGKSEEIFVDFVPKEVVGNGERQALIKITVLNNSFDQYFIKCKGLAYSSDAVIDLAQINQFEDDQGNEDKNENQLLLSNSEIKLAGDSSDHILFPDINLSSGKTSSQSIMTLRSRSNYTLKYELSLADDVPKNIKFSPSVGHLGAFGKREITLTFSSEVPIELTKASIKCILRKIEYQATSSDPKVKSMEESLWGKWDDAMKSIRPAYPEDIKQIQDYEIALKDYNTKVEAEKAKGKKAKPVGPPPDRCLLELAPLGEDGQQMVYEVVSEPFNKLVEDYPSQDLSITCSGVADLLSLECPGNGETLSFSSTYIFQSSAYRFSMQNKSMIKCPIRWYFEDLNARKHKNSSRPVTQNFSRASTAQNRDSDSAANSICPYSIEPESNLINPKASQDFVVKFSPHDAGEFLYTLKGFLNMEPTEASEELKPIIQMNFFGQGKRPVCHFDIKESFDYLTRRQPNLKNENGLFSSIETSNLKIIELESTGLRTRNSFRFYITNTTSESYEFLWETTGEPSPYWRCVQTAGMMFPGKRIEMVFEYLPEDINVAEAFYRFSIPKINLTQLFLFTGKVNEPNVHFSTSKLDFHSVMLGGEGITETVFLENHEHLHFNYNFDKYSLMQLESLGGTVLEISPKEGTVPPHSKIPITFYFKPQEEVVYNYNIVCNVKRKPNKLSINIKGEGYACHPQIQLEQTIIQDLSKSSEKDKAVSEIQEKFITLKPLPIVNYADFGSVQVLDSLSKTITILNAGKYNFDYSWDIEKMGTMITLAGGKLNGTLLKSEELTYSLTFAPKVEGNLTANMNSLSLTIAGKYIYQIIPRGIAIKPALKFSFMDYDFGNCFITSPGGFPVITEKILQIKNEDPFNNITIECLFNKIRTLSIECLPTVLIPGQQLEIPIKFAPREIKDYLFSIPFLINGTSKIPIKISGAGINAKLELINHSQRKLAFGVININQKVTRSVYIVNKSKRELPVQLIDTTEHNTLADHQVSFEPNLEFILKPKEKYDVTVNFHPTKRIGFFQSDLSIKYAGIIRTLTTISGKAQGMEVKLDTDSIPFGLVVLNSQKIKKLTLENVGDLTVYFNWNANSFGPHFSIKPNFGKLLPGNEMVFDVIFRPQFVNEDIRQDNMTLLVSSTNSIIPDSQISSTENDKSGKNLAKSSSLNSDVTPLSITCSGMSISPPIENVQQMNFSSVARKAETKTIKITNPTDRDWFVSPSLQGVDWKIPHEWKVPAKASSDLPVTYYPLTMTASSKTTASPAFPTSSVELPEKHEGKIFIPLPDGSALLYDLIGISGPPDVSDKIVIETPAKKSTTVTLKISNWLSEIQKLVVSIQIINKASPATFVIAANATEVGPNGTKEFPVRFLSFMEGISKAIITMTNPLTGEFCFYELNAKTTMSEVLDTYILESPIRQTTRTIITIENPLYSEAEANNAEIHMGSVAKPTEWFTCDHKCIKVNELISLSNQREGTFEVEYRPLLLSANPTEHLLTIITQELGTFKYKIICKTTSSLLKQSLRFSTTLGSMQTESFLFTSYNSLKCDYQCSVSNHKDIFTLQKPILSVEALSNAWSGENIRLPIQFEPSDIGEFSDKLIVQNNEYGIYEVELIGQCNPPVPLGPFACDFYVGINNTTNIIDFMFRNCFNVNCQWTCTIDSNCFRLSQPAMTNNQFSLNSKAETKCTIIFDPKESDIQNALTNSNGIINAKLFINCITKPNIPAWIYYLRGRISNNPPANLIAQTGKKK